MARVSLTATCPKSCEMQGEAELLGLDASVSLSVTWIEISDPGFVQ